MSQIIRDGMVLGGFQPLSTIDFPGLLACVAFTRGCNFNCFYCHNRSLIPVVGDRVSEEAVLDFIKRRAGLIEGVVVSGGEPTLQDELPYFLQDIKDTDLLVKLDTNGSRPDKVTQLCDAGLIDCLAVDIKAAELHYPQVCGKDGFASALLTLERARLRGVKCYGRTTLYPGLDMEGLKRLLQSLPVMEEYRLNLFRPPAEWLPCHRQLLDRPYINEVELAASWEELTGIQPGLIKEF